MTGSTDPTDTTTGDAWRRVDSKHPRSPVVPAAADNRQAERACEARVQEQLSVSSYPSVRRVRCRCDGGVLTLFGQMPSFHSVQIAISVAKAHLREGVQVRSCLEVRGGR